MFLRIVTIGKGKNFAFNRSNLHVHLIQNSKLCLFLLILKLRMIFLLCIFLMSPKKSNFIIMILDFEWCDTM